MQDEPTSGLDARAAAIVMRTVRNTVNTGRTVVCTIHQPSIDIFEVSFSLMIIPISMNHSGRLSMRDSPVHGVWAKPTANQPLELGLNLPTHAGLR